MHSLSLCRASAHAFVFAITLSAASAAYADIVIDEFSDVGSPDPWPITLTTETTVNATETDLAEVLGGTRETRVQATLIGNPDFDSVSVSIVPGPGPAGDFNYAGSLGSTASIRLLYEGASGNLNADFSSEAGIILDGFLFDASFLSPSFITIVMSDGVNSASMTKVLLEDTLPQLAFVFADYGIPSGNLNLASIDWVRVDFQVGDAVDFRLDSIHTFPVPGAGGLFVLLVSGLCGRRRRS